VFFSSNHGAIDSFTIHFSAGLTLFSFIISIFARLRTHLGKYNFSITLLFFLMSWIISFQIPIEISLGNTELLNFRFIYNKEIVNGMVAFSALVLDAFLLGVTLNYNKLKKNILPIIQEDYVSIKRKYNPKPVFILM